ncbi:hypothetical protein ACNF49_32085 [Actinomadura sp. ATCC 39365]|uniref:hypothetical protein n=1 Tax=Nonomuraea sp. NPDC005692 TaxID=3157168 RepID=UPI0033FBF663
MSTIVSQLFVSLDGVVETPEQWHFPYYDEEMANSPPSGRGRTGTSPSAAA